MEKSLLRTPVKYSRVSSSFSSRRFHPVTKRYQPHYGIDFAADRGTRVFTTGDGVVEEASRNRGNGNYVKVRHNNTYTTYYLHLKGFAKGIHKGVRVSQGQTIGYVGSTGFANGPHVCYRMKRGGSWVNPRRLKLPAKEPVPKTDLAAFHASRDVYLQTLSDWRPQGSDNGTVVVQQLSKPLPDDIF